MNLMSKILSGLVVMMVVVAVAFPARADDDMEKWKASLDQREQSLKLKERRVELDRREAKIEQRAQAVKEGRLDDDSAGRRPHDGAGREGRDGDERGWHGGGNALHCPYWRKFLVYLGIIHLMLSVIVFRDVRMAVPSMSGIWVAVVLMGGIPATVAYALFRLVVIKSAKSG